MTNRNNRHKTA